MSADRLDGAYRALERAAALLDGPVLGYIAAADDELARAEADADFDDRTDEADRIRGILEAVNGLEEATKGVRALVNVTRERVKR